MKIRKIIPSFLLGLSLMVPGVVFGAAAATDNEIAIQQTGDTLKLYIDQVGYGNKACGTLSSSVCGSDWVITGHTLEIDIDQIGNNNKLIGPIILTNSTIDLKFTGDSNTWDWNIGANANETPIFSPPLYTTVINSDGSSSTTGNGGYGYYYNFKEFYGPQALSGNGIVLPAYEPAVFELKNPEQNIKGIVR